MSPQILDQCQQPSFVVLQQAEREIAPVAEKTTDGAGYMVMVDDECPLATGSIGSTGCTTSSLALQHGLVGGQCQSPAILEGISPLSQAFALSGQGQDRIPESDWIEGGCGILGQFASPVHPASIPSRLLLADALVGRLVDQSSLLRVGGCVCATSGIRAGLTDRAPAADSLARLDFMEPGDGLRGAAVGAGLLSHHNHAVYAGRLPSQVRL